MARADGLLGERITVALRSQDDVVVFRQRVRAVAVDLGFSLVDQTKVVTAASEIGRNAVLYGGGGEAVLEPIDNGGRHGLAITVQDEGPGIPNVEVALRPGYSTGNGLGLGLSGARRLVHEFKLDSAVGIGTTVRFVRWK